MQKKSKEIYDGLRRITGKRAQKVRVIKDNNGKVLTDQDQVKNRWREHFQELYNPQTVTDPSVLMEMPVGGRNGDPTAGLTIEEVQAAIHRLKKNIKSRALITQRLMKFKEQGMPVWSSC